MNPASSKALIPIPSDCAAGGLRPRGQGGFCDKSCQGTGVYSRVDVINPFTTAEHS